LAPATSCADTTSSCSMNARAASFISSSTLACAFSNSSSIGSSACPWPAIQQGINEQSYMIQLIGAAEKAKIVAEEKTLLSDLCAYRDVLCLPKDMKH
jgi:hypothetical protein